MIDKLETVENVLKPIEEQLKLADWFKSCKTVLLNLLETFRGNPDKDWWSRIMTIDRQFGSGGGKMKSCLFHAFFFSTKVLTLMDGM